VVRELAVASKSGCQNRQQLSVKGLTYLADQGLLDNVELLLHGGKSANGWQWACLDSIEAIGVQRHWECMLTP
jgi:hypothetical protein